MIVAMFAVVAALSGCASMNKDECLTVDWQMVGYEDGAAGRAGERIARHRKACAKHGVTPDLALYQQGRERGLREYCVPANGFRLGQSGNGYVGICPADLEAQFVDAYDAGRHLYQLQSRVSNTSHQLDAKRRELNDIEHDIKDSSILVVSKESTAEERAQAVLDVKQLAERAGRLKSEIRQLEEDRVHHERDLEDYRATVRYR